jgi:uncharacterized membrane protein YqgA involved in biofilm formation
LRRPESLRCQRAAIFFVSFAGKGLHNRVVIGPFLNGMGILMGALFGLGMRHPMTGRTQSFFKSALGASAAFYGLGLIYLNVHGTFLGCLKQLLIGALGAVLGYWVGRALQLQTMSNRAGHYASTLLASAQKPSPHTPAAGFVAATILFCAAPLGIVGAVVDGTEGYFYLLLVKGIMDGLAMTSFVKLFRWPVALAAAPVFFFFDGLSLVAHHLQPWLDTQGLISYVCIAAGLVTCSVALVILEVRRVELANYLPALAVAPLLAHWLA